MIIKGNFHHRINNPDRYHDKERAFVKAFEDYDYNYKFDFFAGTDDYGDPVRHLSNQEMSLVLTVIQWLGTPVGQSFLNKAENIYLQQKLDRR